MPKEKKSLIESISRGIDKGLVGIDIPNFSSGKKNVFGSAEVKNVNLKEYLKIIKYKELEWFIQFQLNLDDTFEYKDSGARLTYENGTIKSASTDRLVEGLNPGCNDCTLLHSAYLDDNFTENGRKFLDMTLTAVYYQNQ